MDHAQLVERAAIWLRKVENCKVVLKEFRSVLDEIPDAIGWKNNGTMSILIECKATRSDFLKDKNKSFRKQSVISLGRLRFYMVPKGLIELDELPRGWGLLEVTDKKIYVTHRPQPRTFDTRISALEIRILFAATQRYQLDPRIDGANPMTLQEKGWVPRSGRKRRRRRRRYG